MLSKPCSFTTTASDKLVTSLCKQGYGCLGSNNTQYARQSVTWSDRGSRGHHLKPQDLPVTNQLRSLFQHRNCFAFPLILWYFNKTWRQLTTHVMHGAHVSLPSDENRNRRGRKILPFERQSGYTFAKSKSYLVIRAKLPVCVLVLQLLRDFWPRYKQFCKELSWCGQWNYNSCHSIIEKQKMCFSVFLSLLWYPINVGINIIKVISQSFSSRFQAIFSLTVLIMRDSLDCIKMLRYHRHNWVKYQQNAALWTGMCRILNVNSLLISLRVKN